ncbi:phage Gp37/Gp68 family protein [Paraburkholderia diazotrophica]|uniref:Protein gp37 n=1 Tax=Paraburkholderia diazotrophica TaxID=667676 RepID=A0A1H6QKZ2_9BURK|nr:phage Gp37/Gp68 family protein [Paraburkholderia diazotrophica]SEI41624.1 protein gp37 [Paraburkholderia diazotrophica]
MSENSKIEWTDHTFNPWEGCQKVGPGCDHCYAETRNARFAGGTAINWGPGAPRRRTSVANWRKPLQWNKAHAEFFAQHGRRQRVFCASLADVFDNAVDPIWRRDLFDLIELTPNLDWLLLTKRIGNVFEMVARARSHDWLAGRHNVWLGATVVNQAEADRDIPKLLAVPARVHFLSIEPMLGPIDLERPMPGPDLPQGGGASICQPWMIQSGIDWVICGGESGPGARPMHPNWARDVRDQCAEAGVPFLFKQWGEWTPGENVGRQTGVVKTAHWFADDWMFGEESLASYGHVDDEPDLYRIGKRAAGRHLDGRTHDEFPRGAA